MMQKGTLQRSILHLLEHTGTPMTVCDIIREMPREVTPNNLKVTLCGLVKDYRIIRVSRGVYQFPEQNP